MQQEQAPKWPALVTPLLEPYTWEEATATLERMDWRAWFPAGLVINMRRFLMILVREGPPLPPLVVGPIPL